MCADRHPGDGRVRVVPTRSDRTIALSLATGLPASVDAAAAERPTLAIDVAAPGPRGGHAP